jgi:ABC-type Fe3+-hydroxamate transport system substrate-binding protein
MLDPAEDLRDDLGQLVSPPERVRRIVSLVPSLTEAIAASGPGLLVGATDWCSHPRGLEVTRVGGTKNPDVAGVVALLPDLVVANQEENRDDDLAALRAAGLAVWVTAPTTLDEAFGSLSRMLAACGLPSPGWLHEARVAWSTPYTGARRRAFVPIWRKPWMCLGHETFAGDVLSRLGVDNVYAESAERYPRVTLDDVRARDPELVVLPDEPYAFTRDEGRDAFGSWRVPVVHVSGRHLTWYGPSLVEARSVLADGLA